MDSLEASQYPKKRRFPRRNIHRPVGVLCRGVYFVSVATQISEGGLLIQSEFEHKIGECAVVTIQTTTGYYTSVRGEIRNLTNGQYGLEFINLPFKDRRQIRNLVASMNKDSAIHQ